MIKPKPTPNPATIKMLQGSIDWNALYERARNAAEPSALQRQLVEELRQGRSAESLRAVKALQPPRPFEAYDPEALKRRTEFRVRKLRKAAPDLFDQPHGIRALDLGAGRGEFLRFLRDAVPSVAPVGLDIDTSLFQKKTEEDPAYGDMLFLRAPAEAIPVADDSFDLVTGYNSMEHFADPEIVVRECLRVLRPGGSMYFYFGPPWNSPYGPHLQNVCGLPYMHHLFERDVVRQALGIGRENPYEGKNEWPLADFERLFTANSGMRCSYLVYECTWEHLWVVNAFPEEFEHLEPRELVVRAVEVVCRKDGSRPQVRAIRRGSKASAPMDATGSVLAETLPSGALRFSLDAQRLDAERHATVRRRAAVDPHQVAVVKSLFEVEGPSPAPGAVELAVTLNDREVFVRDLAEIDQPVSLELLLANPPFARVAATLRARATASTSDLSSCSVVWQAFTCEAVNSTRQRRSGRRRLGRRLATRLARLRSAASRDAAGKVGG